MISGGHSTREESSYLGPGLGTCWGQTFENRPWLCKPVGAILMQAVQRTNALLALKVSYQPNKHTIMQTLKATNQLSCD